MITPKNLKEKYQCVKQTNKASIFIYDKQIKEKLGELPVSEVLLTEIDLTPYIKWYVKTI